MRLRFFQARRGVSWAARVGMLLALPWAMACGGGTIPSISAVTPNALCPTEGESLVVLAGGGFSPRVVRPLASSADVELPRVRLTRSIALATTGQPGPREVELEQSRVRWTAASSLAFDLGGGLVTPGLYSVEVRNANGETTRVEDAVLVVPPAVGAAALPTAIAQVEGGTVTLSGSYFIKSDAGAPRVSLAPIGGDPIIYEATQLDACQELPGGMGLQACERLLFQVQPGELAAGDYALEVLNPSPANCEVTRQQIRLGAFPFTVVSPPKITSAPVDVTCTSEVPTSVVLEGSDFLTAGAVQPSVTFGEATFPAVASECVPLPLAEGFAPRAAPLSRCAKLSVALPQGALAPGVFKLFVQNPPGAGQSQESVQLYSAPPPTLSSLGGDFVCTSGGNGGLTLTGRDFLQIDGQGPTVRVGAVELPSVGGDCLPLPGFREGVLQCSSLEIELPEASAMGALPITVKNPPMAPCSSKGVFSVMNVPPPTIARVSPDRICQRAETRVDIDGANFLKTAAAGPTVKFSGGPSLDATPTAAKCVPIPGGPAGAQNCSELKVTLPAGSLDSDSVELVVENPDPADCGAKASVPVSIALPPVISGINVSGIAGGTAVLFIVGSGFAPGATVSVQGVELASGAIVSSTNAVATIIASPSDDTATVTIDNRDGCEVSASVAVPIAQQP